MDEKTLILRAKPNSLLLMAIIFHWTFKVYAVCYHNIKEAHIEDSPHA